jgi:hypothetical protein
MKSKKVAKVKKNGSTLKAVDRTSRSLSSANRMVWIYFDSLRRVVNRAATVQDSTQQKDEIVLSLFLAVAAVEIFVNIYFRVLVSQPAFRQHKQMVFNDLNVNSPGGPKGLDYKLRHWPAKILGKSLAWQGGRAKEFDEIRDVRNALMHFTSSHDTATFPNMIIEGMANTTIYDALAPQAALKALNAAEGIVAEILLRSGSTSEQIPQALQAWTGKVPLLVRKDPAEG